MEVQPAESLKPPADPLNVFNRLEENRKLGKEMNVPAFLQDVATLDRTGITKIPELLKHLRDVGRDRIIWGTLFDRLVTEDRENDQPAVKRDIRLAELLGMEELPEMPEFLADLRSRHEKLQEPLPKKSKPRGLKEKVVLAAGVTAIAAASIVGSGAPAAGIGKFLGGLSKGQSTSQEGPSTKSPVKLETKPTATPKAPENLFNEILKPFIDEAMARRKTRAETDPEYAKRIDQELNRDRINLLLFGYGEEYNPTLGKSVFGSQTIFSYDLRTKSFDVVSLTHDIRAPEIERLQQTKGLPPVPTRIDKAWEIGGFPLMRQTLEDATGLSIDLQMVFKDTVIKEMVDNAFGGIVVDVPFDVQTQPFYFEGKQYEGTVFTKGQQKMDGVKALQFIKAWSTSPDPKQERNVRKHIVLDALFNQGKKEIKNPLFLIKLLATINGEEGKNDLQYDFDAKRLLSSNIGGLIGKAGQSLFGGDNSLSSLKIGKRIFVVDSAIGEGGVQWITANAHENPITKKDVESGVYGQDLAMEIPLNANPYADDLVNYYWRSTRDIVKKLLGDTAVSPEKSNPTATATSTITPRPIETPTPTPEVITFKKDIFREQIAPKIYKEILKRRAERAAKDPEYYDRINEKLNEGRINMLISGGREDDPLTDTIQLLSYDPASNSVYVIAIPRDLQSPEVLKKTKDPANSRMNQALGKGGSELLREAVENATALSVDLYFHANFDVLRDFINQTVKTVDVELEKPIVDNEYPTENYGKKSIYYPKGKNTLTGEQALEVARSRHNSLDYERSQRQQKIMEAFIKKLLSENIINQIRYLKTIDDLWYQKVQKGTLKPDFDINQLFFSDLLGLVGDTPGILWERATGGRKIAEMPTIFATGISNRNFVVGAGIPGLSITKISGGNPNTSNPRKDYWSKTRGFTEKFLTEQAGEPPEEEEIKIEIPAKEQRILHPRELSYEEVKPWIGKLRDSHDAVLTESLFTREIAGFTKEKRQEVMQAIATAHAKALTSHYGDVDAIIGLDPGHGGSDIGSSGTAPGGKVLAEKDLTWELSQMIADEIYKQSNGKYTTVFLRPENPHDEDLDDDGVISATERIQKRKALLMEMERKLRGSTSEENLLYLSVHFNGDAGSPNLKGAETFWPNETGVANQGHRDSSHKLAQILHQSILDAIRDTGYQVVDRGAKEDPDKRPPLANSETQTGTYLVLGSAKLDRTLAKR